ncbi:phytanoyl-CoA dioxygenase family protein [Albibacterium bauzanense]|uniref:Ectoine hydroxylase-related dioxygenase (Phytanoyl-CoA dioxygenase family) n=1 Tax=Albibacterium bauzanense TaxID=653929 RepID=A0A4R1M794_9SPHI|nr:phytanoyl-CoA dioxygenase family protein [Albibacterium bauzanense]TCK85563.1 ectoine hydroxylase-related dioxygenase (phytanoyl-CoA dioxygenase family) [Albibacterium bauzanense]
MENKKEILPDLNNTINVPKEKVNEFQELGHTLIRNILSKEEISVYHDVLVDAASRYNSEKRKLEDRDTYGKAFLQIMNLWREDEAAKKFVLAKRFAKIAADLLGVKNVRLYHDQALFKEPGGGPTPWHQDQNYWPLDTTQTITMWMPLVDMPNEDMGMLTFASGSQKKGNIFDYVISDESEGAFEDYVKKNQFKLSRPTYMNAGDATFHQGYTIHNAPGNTSDKMREVMTIIYYADGTKVAKPQHEWQEADHKKWLMEKEVGTLADSELNPALL